MHEEENIVIKMNDRTKLQLNTLLPLLLDGKASEDQIECLYSILSDSPEAVDYYIESISLVSCFLKADTRIASSLNNTTTSQKDIFDKEIWLALGEHEKTAPTIEITEEPQRELIQKVIRPAKEKWEMTKFQISTFIVSAAAILFVIAFPRFFPPKQYRLEVATLVDQVDAQWRREDSSGTLETGSRLWSQEGPLWLKKGTVKVEFDYGAEVIIEGPAEFELVDAEKMILDSGRLYVTVPERATGFTTVTPSATIIDLGTEFGVKVDYDGSSDVHMFKGEASLVPGKAGRKEKGISVLAGKAKRVDVYGEIISINLNPKVFIQPGRYELMSKADKGSAYHRWLLYSDELRQDPSLVAYYTFDKDQENLGQLNNVAGLTSGRLNGQLPEGDSGPRWVTGRWPQKSALKFESEKNKGVTIASDPALSISGPITIAVWVKLSDNDGGGHLISHRDKYRVNYQMSYYGSQDSASGIKSQMQFSRYDSDRSQPGIYSSKQDIKSDQWCLATMTHDGRTVRFYVNGILVSSEEYEFYAEPVDAELIIGDVNISGYASRRFVGTVGEVVILKRVLTDMAIAEMYEAGKP